MFVKKIFLFLLLFIIGSVFVFSKTSALQPGSDSLLNQTAQRSGYKTAGVSATSLSESVGKYIKVILSLVGTIFLALTIYAGILWMTAAGSEDKVSQAISILRSAVIGLAIITSAYSLTAFFVLTNATANTSSSESPCNLDIYPGDANRGWEYGDTSSGVKDGSIDGYAGDAATNKKMSGAWNKTAFTAACAVKGAAVGIVSAICGFGDIFCLGQCNLASECTKGWGDEF